MPQEEKVILKFVERSHIKCHSKKKKVIFNATERKKVILNTTERKSHIKGRRKKKSY